MIAAGENVVIDYYANWCGPCVNFKPSYEAMPADYPNVLFGAVNYDNNSASFSDKGVTSLPTLIYFKNGNEVHRHSGASDSSVRNNLNSRF